MSTPASASPIRGYSTNEERTLSPLEEYFEYVFSRSFALTPPAPPCGVGYLAGRVCRGDFSPAAAVLSLSFRDDEGVVSNAVYRAVDANS